MSKPQAAPPPPPPPPEPAPPPPPPVMSLRAKWAWRGAFVAAAILPLAIAQLWRFGAWTTTWLPNLGARAEYQVPAEAIEITPPPHWVPTDLPDQVAAQAELPETLSLLDDALTSKVSAAYARHPWVEQVVRVTKSLETGVQVELIYRRPVAMVFLNSGMYAVDRAGVLLPPDDFSTADRARYPAIRGVTSAAPTSAGQTWSDPAVIGAARLADSLSARWKEFNLAAIDVPTPRDIPPDPHQDPAEYSGLYVLETTGGSRIVWGRAPGHSYPGELAPKLKLERLDEYLTRFGGFDQPNGPYEIDIRHFREITRRPLTADRPRRGVLR